MNSDLQAILAGDSTLTAISTLLDGQASSIATLTQQVNDSSAGSTALQSQITNLRTEVDTLTQQHTSDIQSIQALNAQVTDAQRLAVRGLTAYTQLHKWPAKTTDSKEVLGLWIDSGGHTAQSNPTTSTIPHGVFTWTPGSDTSPARIVFTPAAGWDDVFIYERFPLEAALPGFVMDRRTFSLSAADRAAVNCIEWQQQFVWNNKVYNCGWQWNFGAKLFRYFDFNNQTWKPVPNVPWIDLGATPVSIETEHVLDAAKETETHLAITIAGTRYPVGVTLDATPKTSGNKYTVSLLQMDANSKGTPFGVNIHDAAALYL